MRVCFFAAWIETAYRRRPGGNGTWRILESVATSIPSEEDQSERLVIVNRDITERKRAEETLAHNALHDSLTNLPNRTLFLDRVRHVLALSQRHASYKFAVLFIDLDEFKVFNDSLGHPAGDVLLIQIARRLTVSIRGADTISRSAPMKGTSTVASEESLARLGGDEFTILLEDIRDCGDAIRVGERIQERLSIPFVVEGQEVVTTASIGIAFCGTSYANSEDLVRDAEIAMYRAKREEKARCQVFDNAMHTLAVKRLRLETELRRALELGEFRVHYQPIVSLQSGKIAEFEALSRWQRPEGLLLPAYFIQIADETGIILPMNRVLLREACLQLRAWHSQFPANPPLTISVNVSPKEFAQPDLAAQIGAILAEVGIDPSSIDVEITETIAMADPQRSSLVLSELKALGVGLSIDDFGTGYSSLSRLQGFPVDKLIASGVQTYSGERMYWEPLRRVLGHLKRALRKERRPTVEKLTQLSEAIINYGRMIHAYHHSSLAEVIVEVPDLSHRFRETEHTIEDAFRLLRGMSC